MRHHTAPENLLKLAVDALRFQAMELHRASAVPHTPEWKAADELEALIKHPTVHLHIARTHRPTHNI